MSTQPAPSENLWVSNLPEGMDDAMLKDIFSQYGTIVQCTMFDVDRFSRQYGTIVHWLVSSGSGVVQFATVEQAAWICENLPGTVPHGLVEAINVRYCAGAGGGGGGGFKGKGGGGGGGGGRISVFLYERSFW